jgi:hypothetical protein
MTDAESKPTPTEALAQLDRDDLQDHFNSIRNDSGSWHERRHHVVVVRERDGGLETSVTTVGDHTRVNPGTEYVFKASVRGDPFMSWDSYFEELSRSIQAAGGRR